MGNISCAQEIFLNVPKNYNIKIVCINMKYVSQMLTDFISLCIYAIV